MGIECGEVDPFGLRNSPKTLPSGDLTTAYRLSLMLLRREWRARSLFRRGYFNGIPTFARTTSGRESDWREDRT